MFFNGIINIVSLGKSDNLAAEEVLVLLKPLGSEHGSVFALSDRLESGGGAALLLNGDDVADLYDIGRNVNLLAVHGEVSVGNELSCLTAGSSETESEYNIVKSALNKGEQLFTGLALSLFRLLIVSAELLLEDAVDKLYLLLLGELQAVFSLFFLLILPPGFLFEVFLL